MRALILILLLLPGAAGSVATELEGHLSYAGQPLTARMDLAVLVYLDRRGGAFVERFVFAAVAVDRGRFAISIDFSSDPQRPRYLEFRVRRSGRNEAFEVLRPRQIMLPRGAGWAFVADPDEPPWRLLLSEPGWG